jgi:leucyl aminopeptidase
LTFALSIIFINAILCDYFLRGISMFDQIFSESEADSIRLIPVITESFESFCEQLPSNVQNWLKTSKFKAKSGQYSMIANDQGGLDSVYVGVETANDFWAFGNLAKSLPVGDYRLDGDLFDEAQCGLVFYAWALGAYTFDRYKKYEGTLARLVLHKHVDKDKLANLMKSVYLARDLINTPAQDLRPTSYADIVKETVEPFKASYKIIDGKKLESEFPGIHAVGKAGEQPPCLVEVNWGDDAHPKLTLVGKGICFDSGGLDLKPAAGMRQMKKDMGGSAIALALTRMIMAQNLPIRLRLILCLAENAVSGNSMRPGDILTMRSGKTVEVGNTDAEGRLVLADGLALACEDKPDYLFDFATLTGAARVAMGPDLPAFLTNNDEMADNLIDSSRKAHEEISRLPLYKPYLEFMKSPIADLSNMSSCPYGGAITAALFLQEFVDKSVSWVHFDVMAANTRDLPGRPKGGEASAFATVYRWAESLAR